MTDSENNIFPKASSPENLSELTLVELQKVRNKLWSTQNTELLQKAESELDRRNPTKDWNCLRCGKSEFHVQTGASVSASTKMHIVICNYCGKSEFYNVLHDQQWP